MKVCVLYHPESDHARAVVDFARDIKQRLGKDVGLLSLEEVTGSDMATLYGVTSYPAVIAVSDSGVMQQLWQDECLPLVNEVAYYLQQP